MKIAIDTISISPHQLPLAHELAKRCEGFAYVYHEHLPERDKLGWAQKEMPKWITTNQSPLEDADLLLSGMRTPDLFARRAAKGLKTFYSSERWFKPPLGRFRLLKPSYLKMALRMRRLIKSGRLVYLPMGVWAAKDMEWVCGRGDFPIWGYFVEPSEWGDDKLREMRAARRAELAEGVRIRVLWVGRLLAWKSVDTLFNAIALGVEKFSWELTVVGMGPEEMRLKTLAAKVNKNAGYEAITMKPQIPIAEVRGLMRSHDIYALPSNAYEGWGAVVSEAVTEAMMVVGSNQAGSSATILPPKRRFNNGDAKGLYRALELAAADLQSPEATGEMLVIAEQWSAKTAAERLMALVENADEPSVTGLLHE